MAVVTVTCTVNATCHFWLLPQAIEDTSGAGVEVPDSLHGYTYPPSDGTPATLTLNLDNAFKWDVEMTFRGAPPIVFEGFEPGDGGDLLELLSAQGWTSL